MTYILYNPLANGGNGLAGVDKVLAAFAEQTPETRDVTKLDMKPFLDGLTENDRVILCGGDGTINYLINDLDGEVPAVPVYVWRFGTGNDFLRDAADKTAQMVLLNDYIGNLPYAEMRGRKIRFINNCSCGMDGLICELGEKAKAKREKGRVNYIWLALRAILLQYKRTTARVTVDGETREYDKVWMASAMNGRFVGGGMRLAPDQDRKSGDLCCFVWHGTNRVMTVIRLLRVFGKGSHVKFKNMCDVRFGRDIRVELGAPMAVQLDGEVISGVTSYTAHK